MTLLRLKDMNFNSRFLQNATSPTVILVLIRFLFQLTLLTKCDLGSLPDGLCRTAISTHASYKMRQQIFIKIISFKEETLNINIILEK